MTGASGAAAEATLQAVEARAPSVSVHSRGRARRAPSPASARRTGGSARCQSAAAAGRPGRAATQGEPAPMARRSGSGGAAVAVTVRRWYIRRCRHQRRPAPGDKAAVMMRGMRRLAVPLLLLLLVPAAAAAAPPVAPPRAPQNPFMAPGSNSNIHDDTWMTDAYRRGGPLRGPLTTLLGALPPSLCGSLTLDSHGRIVTVCPSAVAPPELRLLDQHTLALLAERTLPQAPPPAGTPEFQNFSGGGYFFLDGHDRVWSATKTNHLMVFKATRNGHAFRRLRDYDLTPYVRGKQRIPSALPDFRGRIWFVTKAAGKVGVLNPRTRAVHVKRTGEEIENSFTIGRTGVYVVSDKAMYRWGAGPKGRPRVVWRKRYRNSGQIKPSQVNAGSGTTPTILRGGLVAITDNADPMNVVVYRTARRLHGRPRVVCEVPVFGKGASATENSLIGSGRSLFVENNYGYGNPLDSIPDPLTTPGLTRIDLDKRLTKCHKVWTDHTQRLSSVVPKLSTKTQLIYGYVQDEDTSGRRVWSWVGVSARTGRTRFKQEAGTGPAANNNYAGLALGPDGRTAYLGTIGGVRALRSPR